MDTRLFANSSLDLFVLPLISVSISRRPSFLPTSFGAGGGSVQPAQDRVFTIPRLLFVSSEREREREGSILSTKNSMRTIGSDRVRRQKMQRSTVETTIARHRSITGHTRTLHSFRENLQLERRISRRSGRQVVRFDVFSSRLESMYAWKSGLERTKCPRRFENFEERRKKRNRHGGKRGTWRGRGRGGFRFPRLTGDRRFDRWQRAVSDPVTMTPRKSRNSVDPPPMWSIDQRSRGPIAARWCSRSSRDDLFFQPASGEWGAGRGGGIGAPTPRPDLPPSRSHLDPLLPAAPIIHRRVPRPELPSFHDSNFLLCFDRRDRGNGGVVIEYEMERRSWFTDNLLVNEVKICSCFVLLKE